MTHPLETLVIPAGILLLAFLSALLLPAPMLDINRVRHLMSIIHLIDINQFYTIFYLLWFLLLGAIEFVVLHFFWRRYQH